MWILDSLKMRKNDQTPAIVTRTGSYTFAEVWKNSECLARDIEATGGKTPVVLYGDKHPMMIPTMMAALKSGRAYVPVDISYPPERLRQIAAEVDACVIYNYSDVELDLPFLIRNKKEIAELCRETCEEDIPESHWVKDEDDCYILFTSGSTGKPKGVPITKANILNLLTFDYFYTEGLTQCVLCQYSFSFDPSGILIYFYLSLGKTLICVDKALFKDPPEMVEWMAKNKISYWISTPSVIELCRKCSFFNGETLPELKVFNFGGEILTKSMVEFLHEAFPGVPVYNLYGPTEATIQVVGCEITDEMMADENPLPIGYMMSEADYLIDSENNEMPHDENNPGEFIIISKSVSNGYYNDPEKTAKVFFRAEDGRMAYRTGDLVYEKNGLLYFAGRKDFQVKLSGYRIEIEDVVNNLVKIPFVQDSTVLPVYDAGGKVKCLVAFVSIRPDHPEKNKMKNTIEIKKQLRTLVPSYMVPQKILFLDEFPLNVNGKIDRKALAKMLEKQERTE